MGGEGEAGKENKLLCLTNRPRGSQDFKDHGAGKLECLGFLSLLHAACVGDSPEQFYCCLRGITAV